MLYDKKWDEIKPITKPLEPWQQTLLEAAHELRTRGWCQGVSEDRYGRVCLFGALSLAVGGNPKYIPHDQSHQFEPLMNKLTSVGYSIPWNDTKGRTKEEVIAALEKVAGV